MFKVRCFSYIRLFNQFKTTSILSNTYIKYPIAFNIKTKKLVEILKVTAENKSDLVCLECNENFVGVLNHQTPHFKHKPKSNCQGNVESYIHWITKEVFKELTEIELPEIFKDNLNHKDRQRLDSKVNELIEKNVPRTLQLKFRGSLKKNLSDSRKFEIEKIETEKEFKTDLGNVRIDIVATINNQKLFIEPFWKNPIDKIKMEKLTLINTPTLSINLLSFIQSFDYNYKIENLKNYLINKNTKYWIFNREKQIKKYSEEYLNYVTGEIEKRRFEINEHQSKLKKITELEKKASNLEEKIRPTQDKIKKIRDEIRNIRKDIGEK